MSINYPGNLDYASKKDRNESFLKNVNSILKVSAENSPFYRKRIPGEVSCVAEFKQIPILKRNDFLDNLPPQSNDLITQKPNNCYVLASGGSSGEPKFTFRTHSENDLNSRFLSKGFQLAGLTSNDIVANCLSAGELWGGMLVFNKALELTGSTILPLGNYLPIENVVKYLQMFKVTSLVSLPSMALQIAHYVKRNAIKTLKVPKIFTSGEPLYSEARIFISEILETEHFRSPSYAAMETGAIGYQCQNCKDLEFHIHEELHYLEVVNKDTYEPLPKGEVGRIITTNLTRTLMPIIRYDVGDLAMVITEPCECGRSSKKIRLVGRDDSRIRFGMRFLCAEDFLKIINTIEGISLHFQIILERDNCMEKLVVQVEALDVTEVTPQKNKELENMINEMYKIKRSKNDGHNLLIEGRVLPPGSLPLNPKTGKIKTIIDNRK